MAENSRLRQTAAKCGKLRWKTADCGGKQVGVYKVLRGCPVTIPPFQTRTPVRRGRNESK